jgi:ornithine carbamoyltransferase
MTRQFTDIDDLSADELADVLERAAKYKEQQREGVTPPDLERKTLGMLFQKPSTRTRVSFETGMTQLGGHAVFLGEDDIHLGHGEPLKDTARTLSGYVDAITARVFEHANIEELARYATVPVVNGLTDDAHPCQTLADLLTIRETFGSQKVSVAWVGDANNVARSFALGCALCGVDLTVATPPEYGLDETVLDRAESLGGAPKTTNDPKKAVSGADAVYTDVWISMGQEDQRDYRLSAFEGFQLNEELLENAPDAKVLHCLPANRGEEITDAVVESERSLVFSQAENRLHAQKGLLSWLLA